MELNSPPKAPVIVTDMEWKFVNGAKWDTTIDPRTDSIDEDAEVIYVKLGERISTLNPEVTIPAENVRIFKCNLVTEHSKQRPVHELSPEQLHELQTLINPTRLGPVRSR